MVNIELRMQQDKHTDEYRVAVLVNGRLNEAMTYYTDDLDDAKGTLNLMVEVFKRDGVFRDTKINTVDVLERVSRIDFETWRAI